LPLLASVCAMQLAACCCTRQLSVDRSRRWRSLWNGAPNRCPLGLPADGLHAGLLRWRARMLSSRAPSLNRSECRLRVCARCRGTSSGSLGADPTGRFGAASSGPQMSVQGRTEPPDATAFRSVTGFWRPVRTRDRPVASGWRFRWPADRRKTRSRSNLHAGTRYEGAGVPCLRSTKPISSVV